MTSVRRRPFDDREACCYHLVSRCVRGALLCGTDEYTQRDFSHRKAWLVDRLATLADCFSVVVLGNAVSRDHFHVVVHYDPKACIWWDDEEVASRWIDVFAPTRGSRPELQTVAARQSLLAEPERVERARRALGSLSEFMRYLKQPISRFANLESQAAGHFFEAGYYAGALLSEQSVRAATKYVDLTPFLPMLDKWLEVCPASALRERGARKQRPALGTLSAAYTLTECSLRCGSTGRCSLLCHSDAQRTASRRQRRSPPPVRLSSPHRRRKTWRPSGSGQAAAVQARC